MKMKLINGDCLKVLPTILDESIDLILTDLPYGVTQNKNDKTLPLETLWKQFKRIIREDGNVILTSQFPYTIDLIISNQSWFKYDLIWNKVLPTGFLNSHKMPLRVHEHILVFYNTSSKYNPQFSTGEQSHSKGKMKTETNKNYGKYGKIDNSKRYGNNKFPLSILTFPKPHPSIALHPTQKPIELFEYLIKTYSNENDMVLDCCLGAGTTLEACKNTNRNCIGIEINPHYCEIVKKRCFNNTLIDREVDYNYEEVK